MESNQSLASAILKKLLTFPYGIGKICADDFGVPHDVFAAQINRMLNNANGNRALIDFAEGQVVVFLANNSETIHLSITGAGREYINKQCH